MKYGDPMPCPQDQELLDSLASVMRSVAAGIHHHGPDTYGLFSNAVLGERIMQICEELSSIADFTFLLGGEEAKKFDDLIEEASFIGVELKMFRKST